MTKYVITVSQEANLATTAKLIEENNIKKLPVIDKNDNIVGIITATDIVINQHSTIKRLSKQLARQK